MLDEVELQLLKMIIDSKVELPGGNGNILGKIKNVNGGVIFATGTTGYFYCISYMNAKKILEYTEEKYLVNQTSLVKMMDKKQEGGVYIFPYNNSIESVLGLLIPLGYSPSEEDIFEAWCCDTSEITASAELGIEDSRSGSQNSNIYFEDIKEVSTKVQSHAEVWESKALRLYNIIDNHLSDKDSTKEDLDSDFRSIVNYFKNNQEGK